jgi:hypothetical protein
LSRFAQKTWLLHLIEEAGAGRLIRETSCLENEGRLAGYGCQCVKFMLAVNRILESTAEALRRRE